MERPPTGLAGDTCLRESAPAWFGELRDALCAAFEAIEDGHTGPLGERPPGRFAQRSWNREGGGGGVMAVMRGRVFEKVGVNVSTVWGEFREDLRGEIPGTSPGDGRFWASGISVVAHMASPLVPGAHMNTRHLATAGKAWFGGGADLNPPFPCARDTADFHDALRACCARHDCADHDAFSAWADDYFFIRHRGVARGVGGIFYDDIAADDGSFAFTRDVGATFRTIFPRLVQRNAGRPWTGEQRERQLVYRGRYAEFNLVCDRGTRFGLLTGGDPDAVLMSLPPEAAWP